MRKMLYFLFFVPFLYGQNVQELPKMPNYFTTEWKTSATFLGLSEALDGFSSFGKYERNPVLASNGKFGAKGIVIKTGMVGTSLALQYFLIKTTKSRRVAKVVSYINFSMGTAFVGVSIHNFKIKRP